jgi:DNA repair protein RadC
MRIKDISKVDRPREKVKKYGINKLNNVELLALVLGTGRKGENVIELSRKILRTFSHEEFSSLLWNDLRCIKGLGEAKICTLLACFELGKRLVNHKKSVLILSSKDVWEEMKDLRGSKKEHFVSFYLDVRNQIIRRDIISIGNLNTSLVHPREVFEPAVKNLAAQIILCHNHPSGECEPSNEDLAITKKLIKAGEILGIEIVDHVVVTENKFFSMKEKQLI